ncbi:hypothetical protein BCF46_0666 [Litoreibacter meonggei]|uniref:Uncharacterized protein n=1 Tax=Litoreibacter meonggei TaxID=1049199 RepID=A0A497X5G0_9RHOB|nr:hypothetical protein BCF46_0666 [Litoreibacter meonggei]
MGWQTSQHSPDYNARFTARAAPLTSWPMPSTVSQPASANTKARPIKLNRVIIWVILSASSSAKFTKLRA